MMLDALNFSIPTNLCGIYSSTVLDVPMIRPSIPYEQVDDDLQLYVILLLRFDVTENQV
jgi:hypothetical protein